MEKVNKYRVRSYVSNTKDYSPMINWSVERCINDMRSDHWVNVGHYDCKDDAVRVANNLKRLDKFVIDFQEEIIEL